MAGVDAKTGKPLYGDARIVQSIRRLILTDHDLLMRRHLHCQLPDAIGAPNNAVEALAYCSAVAGALAKGEPRCDLKTIRFLESGEVPTVAGENLGPEASADGQAWLNISASSVETGQPIELSELIT